VSIIILFFYGAIELLGSFAVVLCECIFLEVVGSCSPFTVDSVLKHDKILINVFYVSIL